MFKSKSESRWTESKGGGYWRDRAREVVGNFNSGKGVSMREREEEGGRGRLWESSGYAVSRNLY